VPPAPSPDDVDLTQLDFRQLHVALTSERLKPPLKDGWLLPAFLRVTGRLVRLHVLPERSAQLGRFLSPAVAGAPPVPLTTDQVGELGSVAGIPVDDAKLSRSLEHPPNPRQSRSR
jgi:hypothetical protein